MKKICSLLLVFGLLFFVASCDKPVDPTPEKKFDLTLTVDPSSVEVAYGASYRALTGVKAIGNDEVSYGTKVTFTSTTLTFDKGYVDTKNTGTHKITYSVTVQEVTKNAERTLVIGEKPDTTGNLLKNPDFDADYTGWTKFSDGSNLTWETEMIGETSFAKMVQETISGNTFSPRLHNTGENYIQLYVGTKYKVSFDAKASNAKPISCQVGQVLGGDPYWYELDGVEPFNFTLSETMSTYSFTFAMGTPDNAAADLSKASVTFEMGTVKGNSAPATIWLGNIVFEEFEGEIADEVAPNIVANNKTVFVGDFEELDLTTIISVNDAIDGAITPTIEIKNALNEVVTSISGSVDGVYTVKITAVDKAGNDSEKTITITVKQKTVSTNPFGTPDGAIKGDELGTVNNPGKFIYWMVEDAGWGIGPVCNTVATYENGILKFVNTQPADAKSWGIQAFYDTEIIQDTNQYVFSVKINSTVAGFFTISMNGVDKIVELAVGDNVVKFACGKIESGKTAHLKLVFGKAETVNEVTTEYPLGDATLEFSDFKLEANVIGPIIEAIKGGAPDTSANPDKFLYWMVEDAGWGIGPVCNTVVTCENGALQFVNTQPADAKAFGVQAFYETEILQKGGQYIFAVTINSTVTGDITINVNGVIKVVTLAIGDNQIEFDCGYVEVGGSIKIGVVFGSQANDVEAPIGDATFIFKDFCLA